MKALTDAAIRRQHLYLCHRLMKKRCAARLRELTDALRAQVFLFHLGPYSQSHHYRRRSHQQIQR